MPRNVWLVGAGVLAVVLVVTVVGLTWPRHHPAAAPPVTSASVQPWQRTDLRPVSQPVAAANDSRFLVYIASAGKLRLTSLFSASGATAWTRNASSSVIAPGVVPQLTLVGGAVIYLEPMAVPGSAQMVAAAADSGRILWRSSPGFFTSWPTVCPDDTGWVCSTGNMASAGEANTLRFDARTGQTGAGVAMASDGGRELTPGLYSSQARDPELLIAASGSHILWQRPIDEVFTFRGASTDYGWTFNGIRHEGLFVGSVGSPPRHVDGKSVLDMSRTATVGLRAADGSVVWRNKGTYYLCNDLPCAGGVEDSAPSTPASVSAAGTRVGLRLRTTELLGWSSRRQRPTLSKGAHGQLEGFSPSTGRTLWTFDASRDHYLLTLQTPVLGPNGAIAVRNAAGREVLLDPETGRTSAIAEKEVLACSAPTQYRTTVGYRTSKRTVLHVHVGSPAVFPCTSQAIRTDGPPPGAARVLVGSSPLAAWGDTTGVYAAPVPSGAVAG